MYVSLEIKLSKFLEQCGSKLNKKTTNGTGAIYVPLGVANITIFSDESPDGQYPEGSVRSVLINEYKRNPKARAVCLAHYGHSCFVCNFNFGDVYGSIGNDFIHVHHLKEISSSDEEYSVDPINDLRPLCPNCHAMVHTQKPAIAPEELRKLLKSANQNGR